MNDHQLAGALAAQAGELLLDVRRELAGATAEERKAEGDKRSHVYLMDELAAARPDDAVLSEEASAAERANTGRLTADRVWIVDPLDGTREFSELGRSDWAVHVALWQSGELVAGAVALPAQGVTLVTPDVAAPPAAPSTPRIVVSRTRPPAVALAVCDALNGVLVEMGSAGAKVASVVQGLADVYALQAQWEDASRLYQEALDYHVRKGDAVRQARVQSRIGSTFSGVFDFRQALPHIQSAIQKLEGQQAEAELAGVYVQMARTQAYIGNFLDAEQYARSGLQLADRHQLLPLAAEAHGVLALISFFLAGGPPEAFVRSIEIAEQLNDLSRAISSYNGMAAAHAYRGEYKEALATTDRALALAQETSNQPRLALSLYKLGEFRVLTGEWKQAQTALEQYLAMSEAAGMWVENARGLLAFIRGDLDLAIDAMVKAIAISERQRNLNNLGIVADWTGFLHLRQRRYDSAKRMLAEFIDRYTALGMFWPAYLHPLAAEAALGVGDLEAAAEHCRQAEAFRHLDLKPAQARLQKAVGLLHAAGRSWSESVTSLRAAADLYAEIGQPYDQALCIEALAAAQSGQDSFSSHESASTLLREAIAIYERLGAAFEVRRLQESPILK